jgi:hypothetical protein
LAWGILIVVILIVLFRDQMAWLADFLIDPGASVPDPSQIDLPIVNQLSEGESS